jgi:hypothetical protein
MAGKPRGASGRERDAAPKRGAMAASTKREGIKAETSAVVCYLLPEERKRLRQLALDLDTTVQELLLQGLDHVFAQHGQSPVNRYVPLRKRRGEDRD